LVASAGVAAIPSIELMQQPFSWSEDFSAISNHWGGTLLGLGGGEDLPVLHHETYDFPDELTPIGVELWMQIALGATGNASTEEYRGVQNASDSVDL